MESHQAGMAFLLGLPLLSIEEEGVEGGVFDVGNSDRYIQQATMTKDGLGSPEFTQSFNQLYNKIVQQS